MNPWPTIVIWEDIEPSSTKPVFSAGQYVGLIAHTREYRIQVSLPWYIR